jgi:hypothetical protein
VLETQSPRNDRSIKVKLGQERQEPRNSLQRGNFEALAAADKASSTANASAFVYLAPFAGLI